MERVFWALHQCRFERHSADRAVSPCRQPRRQSRTCGQVGGTGDRPPFVTVLARAYARRAIRHRFKRRRDEWGETIGEWRDRTASLPRHTPGGRRIAVCPATYSGATCRSCGACALVRDAVIGFPAHGAWRQVEAAIAARDVPAGESWIFENHRTMAEVIVEEAAA